MLSFNLNKVNFNEQLSSGSSWTVHPYQKNSDDKKWMAKHIVTSKVHTMLKQMNNITLRFSLDHPNILSVCGYSINFDEISKNWNIYAKTSRMQESLKDKIKSYIDKKKAFSKDDLIKYFYAMTFGLKYLHERKISHGDFRPENVLIGLEGQVKIDIGGYNGEDVMAEKAERLFYSAPETVNANSQLKKKDLIKADAWSLGMVIAEMCLTKETLGDLSLLEDKNEAEISLALRDVEEKYSKELIDLIKDLLKSDPTQRKSVTEVHKILKEKYKRILGLEEDIVKKGKIRRVVFEESKQGERVGKVVKPVQDLVTVKEMIDKKWEKTFGIKFEEPEKRVTIHPKVFDRMFDGDVKNFLDDLVQHQSAIQSREFQSFSLNLINCNRITDKAVEAVGQYIESNVTNFQNINLSFWESRRITDEAVILLGRSLSHIKELQNLNLNFDFCQNITEKGLTDLIKNLQQNGQNLKKFVLKLGSCQKIQDINVISQAIGASFPNLEELSLDLSRSQFGDNAISGIGPGLGSLKNIKILALNFENNGAVTLEGMKTCLTGVARILQKLEKLHLNLGNCSFSGPSVHILKYPFIDPSIFEVQLCSNMRNFNRM